MQELERSCRRRVTTVDCPSIRRFAKSCGQAVYASTAAHTIAQAFPFKQTILLARTQTLPIQLRLGPPIAVLPAFPHAWHQWSRILSQRILRQLVLAISRQAVHRFTIPCSRSGCAPHLFRQVLSRWAAKTRGSRFAPQWHLYRDLWHRPPFLTSRLPTAPPGIRHLCNLWS